MREIKMVTGTKGHWKKVYIKLYKVCICFNDLYHVTTKYLGDKCKFVIIVNQVNKINISLYKI